MKRKMETFKKAQKALEPLGIKPTAYGLRKALNQRGIDISINGVSNYIKQPCKSIRPDVLICLQELCAEAGVSLTTFWGWFKKDIS
jgi:hypothetical protein